MFEVHSPHCCSFAETEQDAMRMYRERIKFRFALVLNVKTRVVVEFHGDVDPGDYQIKENHAEG